MSSINEEQTYKTISSFNWYLLLFVKRLYKDVGHRRSRTPFRFFYIPLGHFHTFLLHSGRSRGTLRDTTSVSDVRREER